MDSDGVPFGESVSVHSCSSPEILGFRFFPGLVPPPVRLPLHGGNRGRPDEGKGLYGILLPAGRHYQGMRISTVYLKHLSDRFKGDPSFGPLSSSHS
jgi:hypothetical protein